MLLEMLAGYRREWLRHDLAAGVSVAAVALPTAIAYAEIVGLDPVVGLNTIDSTGAETLKALAHDRQKFQRTATRAPASGPLADRVCWQAGGKTNARPGTHGEGKRVELTGGVARFSRPVHIFSMRHPQDQNHQHGVVDFVHYAIAANPDSPEVFIAGEFHRSGRLWILTQFL